MMQLQSSALACLQGVQLELNSSVATNTLFFPQGLCKDVAYRLEAARLVINHHGWLPQPLEPLLAEVELSELWKPDLLKIAIVREITISQGNMAPIMLAEKSILTDFFKDYEVLYNAAQLS